MSYKSWLLFVILIIKFDINAFGATMNEYIITETDQPTSLDPLEADQTQNLPVARMIYATPLEIDASDAISSLVLEKFNYDKLTKTIHWKVKKGLKYANGEDMTADDVAFSVLRMAFARPKFPVIDSIEGVSEWVKKSAPLKSLPKGINVTGQEITIKLTRDHPHPLFRFCLELFSIIPKKCVDLKTSKITCEKIPESGRYKIESRDQATIQFKKRIDTSDPESIKFKYMSAVHTATELKNISGQSVIAGNESMYSSDELEVFRKFDSFYYLPASRFAVLQISPEIAPFNDKLCRVVFAHQFRQEYEKTTKESSAAESSIFTKIISGYLNRKDLENTVVSKLKKSEIDSCVQRLRKSKIKWGYVENEKNSGFVKAFLQTLKSLELKGQPLVFKTRKEQAEKFVQSDDLLVFLKELKLQRGHDEFVLPHLTEWSRGDAAVVLRGFCSSIKLTQIRFHDLRATFITNLLARGESLVRVMAIVGHEDMDTTNVYVRKAGIELTGGTEKLGYKVPSGKSAKLLRLV